MSPNSGGFHPLIHILDDDSLLYMFNLCRPVLVDGGHIHDSPIPWKAYWVRERWWYKLAQVCQRWRHLVLAFASHLDLCLVCTYGTPVADMLAHSPPLPLAIDYPGRSDGFTTEDEEGITLALRHRGRVRRIRLELRFSYLQRLILTIDGEFPMLDYHDFAPRANSHRHNLIFPETFRAPHLRHLITRGIDLSRRSSLLMTYVDLVTFSLRAFHAYFSPNDLPNWLSHMPQLETLRASLPFDFPSRDIERKLLLTPITTYAMLPNLRWFEFEGVSTYLEALLPRITVPLLETFRILFVDEHTFSTQNLSQFMGTIEGFRCSSAGFGFDYNFVVAWVHTLKEANKLTFIMNFCSPLDQQVAQIAQIFRAFGTVSSAVEHLSLDHGKASPLKASYKVDPARWYKLLLGSFSSVKSLYLNDDPVEDISRSLQSDDGGFHTELLPELKELSYFAGVRRNDPGEALTAFIDARQNAGRPVTLLRV